MIPAYRSAIPGWRSVVAGLPTEAAGAQVGQSSARVGSRSVPVGARRATAGDRPVRAASSRHAGRPAVCIDRPAAGSGLAGILPCGRTAPTPHSSAPEPERAPPVPPTIPVVLPPFLRARQTLAHPFSSLVPLSPIAHRSTADRLHFIPSFAISKTLPKVERNPYSHRLPSAVVRLRPQVSHL